MAKYILSNKAVEDLSLIWEYTCEAWSERQADIYYNLLVAACRDLAQKIRKGKPYPEIGPGILGFKTGRHIIFYRVGKSENIEVARVLHEEMDLQTRMQE